MWFTLYTIIPSCVKCGVFGAHYTKLHNACQYNSIFAFQLYIPKPEIVARVRP